MVSKAVVLLLLASAVIADMNKDFKSILHGEGTLTNETLE